jgi:hypothetical protein
LFSRVETMKERNKKLEKQEMSVAGLLQFCKKNYIKSIFLEN